MNLPLGASATMAAHRFIFYLPDKDRYGNQVPDIEDWVTESCLLLATLNGGATRLPAAQGMWLNRKEGRLIHETTHIHGVLLCGHGKLLSEHWLNSRLCLQLRKSDESGKRRRGV